MGHLERHKEKVSLKTVSYIYTRSWEPRSALQTLFLLMRSADGPFAKRLSKHTSKFTIFVRKLHSK